MTQKVQQKVGLELRTGSTKRSNPPVEVAIDNADMLRLFNEHGQGHFLLREMNSEKFIPFQLEASDKHLDLSFFLEGETLEDTTLDYELLSGADGDAAQQLVSVSERADYQGQDSFEITTPAATYIYHKQGGGFASMIDNEGHDWLSYRPHGGSDGKYRGIPNLVYPEGYFHPGGTECTSRLVKQGPIKAEIYSETQNGEWACKWDIFPQFARLTVLKAPKEYWFLYEGTPGGELDEKNDFCVRSSGIRSPAAERWEDLLPDPHWIYFGAGNTERVLYLLHHERGQGTDSYWPMEGNMTVFGFGRSNLESYLTKTPARFTVGFFETQEPELVQAFLKGLDEPLTCTVINV